MKTISIADDNGQEYKFIHPRTNDFKLIGIDRGIIIALCKIKGERTPLVFNKDGVSSHPNAMYNTFNLAPYNHIAELTRCQSEGAIIVYDTPSESVKIKDDITIKQWDQHKIAIMAFWEDGEVLLVYPSSAESLLKNPTWGKDCTYKPASFTKGEANQRIAEVFANDKITAKSQAVRDIVERIE